MQANDTSNASNSWGYSYTDVVGRSYPYKKETVNANRWNQYLFARNNTPPHTVILSLAQELYSRGCIDVKYWKYSLIVHLDWKAHSLIVQDTYCDNSKRYISFYSLIVKGYINHEGKSNFFKGNLIFWSLMQDTLTINVLTFDSWTGPGISFLCCIIKSSHRIQRLQIIHSMSSSASHKAKEKNQVTRSQIPAPISKGPSKYRQQTNVKTI